MTESAAPIPVAIVFGTRPEAVKLLDPIRLLRNDPRFALRVFLTGQHREMVDEILRPFGVVPDVDLGIMQAGQTLNEIVSRSMPRLDQLYADERPRMVVVQGDTTSAMCAALAAFHRRIAVAHVEAGLRSFDRFHPYPEEANRRMVSSIADLHFAPTPRSAQNLLDEGIPRRAVIVTGNTVVDTLLSTLREQPQQSKLTLRGGGLVLITLHRREGWDSPGSGTASVMDGVMGAIERAARAHPEVDFVYPVHLNPRVREPAHAILGRTPNVQLVEPIPYIPFVQLIARATAILTDSGGIQEEAPSLGVPVLVLRKTTERPEGLAFGNRLIGTEPARIQEELARVLAERAAAPRPPLDRPPVPAPNPFGDGGASARIRDAILAFFDLLDAPREFGDPAELARLRVRPSHAP